VGTRQGDVALLNDPLAQELLRARVPARLAYVWPDGTPRVVPIGFHWTGAEVVLGTPPDAPKVRALRRNPQVALTIDTDAFPYKVLLIRGAATVDVVAGVVPEYAQMCRRNLGEEGARA
jgi:PPOX class probable F420-dependent enzyme